MDVDVCVSAIREKQALGWLPERLIQMAPQGKQLSETKGTKATLFPASRPAQKPLLPPKKSSLGWGSEELPAGSGRTLGEAAFLQVSHWKKRPRPIRKAAK